ncbi:hypothetical protein B2J86_01885 [Acidovorax sp. SRB_14]|uniref:DUF3619 family protein n=1 Tax=unclassified Acidovorax TaxID=2684926 RepID=UPI00145DB004|nr:MULTISPECIES: DUF3619 family protein [unclassified Acidovorax]NMM75697.1 hypothetical protein [Acidovorax sp. SRB_24]NMM79689.1 hypothetical protein [Acidovorax sp. SRB_14]NMM87169.1 hypothetical protein [Rhodococcus sp. SRB_17]
MKTSPPPPPELAADRFARRVTARLDQGAGELPYDVSERLRAARMQALAKRKKPAPVHQPAPAVVPLGASAALGWGSEGGSWWRSVLSAVPVMALLAGLVIINFAQDEYGTAEVVAVDAALLTDDLPPAAYADPGFVQFLKTGGTQSN